MSATAIKRFIVIGIIAVVLSVVTMTVIGHFDRPPGDYEVEKGQIHLDVREYDEALADFDAALVVSPNHRGALMGRAIVFLQTGREREAEQELTHLINFLEANLEDDDPTGRGTLAAAYANLGILYDRQGQYEEALLAYLEALRVDEESVEGPGLFHRIIHNPRPANVRDRAQYISEQLQLPEDERLLAVPEIDAQQRMHKP